MIKSSVLSVIFSLCLASISAQSYEVPTDYSVETAEECEALHPVIIETIDWLHETPIDEDTRKRAQAEAFFLKWLESTPTVGVVLHAELLEFVKKNPELFSTFLGGWAKFAITNPEQKDDMAAGALAGIKDLLTFIDANPSIKKSKPVKKLYAMQEAGELEEWLADIF